MKYFLILLIFPIISLSIPDQKEIKIEWADNLEGDFSFSEEWSYAENVFINEFGQLVCDGFCGEEFQNMRDENGRIFDDSLNRYYQLLDTAHYYHTISCDAQSYEFTGTDYIETINLGNDTIRCYTMCNAGTHSSLIFDIINNKCTPIIELNSITSIEKQLFPLDGGYIKIDKAYWEKGILKAEFNFTFINSEFPMWWKGRIYTPIKNK